MANSFSAAALILAAGSAKRFGRDKQFASINKIPVIELTVKNFLKSKKVKEIIVAFSRDNFEKGRRLFLKEKKVKTVIGGKTRMESLKNAFAALSYKPDIVCVHDGARPFVDKRLIENLIGNAFKYKAAVPVVPLKDTVKKVSKNKILSTIDRKSYAAVQTPQCYRTEIFKKIISLPKSSRDLTDDSQLLEEINIKAFAVESSYENFKITTPEDLILAEAVYEKKYKKIG
ncbi:MAG: 2-C-methyl-D-erythritol 4-phosphate cytidylyltransferase [Elusimicrobiota bacterium]